MKMPTLVGIFIFTSRENFMLSWVEHEKRFITFEPDLNLRRAHLSKGTFSYFAVQMDNVEQGRSW